MLVLQRSAGERIVIGEGQDGIIVELVDIRGDRCRIGVTAPNSVRIDREEIAIAREAAAASVTPADLAKLGKGTP